MSINAMIEKNEASIEELSKINNVLKAVDGASTVLLITSQDDKVQSTSFGVSIESLVRMPMAILRKRMEDMDHDTRVSVKALLVDEINAMEYLFDNTPEATPE